jgi:SAM-dependent methyltransferase
MERMVQIMGKYVHGYSDKELKRLGDQANTLDSLLHHDTVFTKGNRVLEAGCGTGEQTKIIARENPLSLFTSIDISNDSLKKAKNIIQEINLQNVQLLNADIFHLPFSDECFDHVFLCFVLEHLGDPDKALDEFKRVLKKNGTIMMIEGDHGSTYFYPDSREAHLAIQCLVELQGRGKGDANIGRRLYPLLENSDFRNIKISPRMVYVDDSKPGLVEGFTRNTFAAMIEGVKEKAISEKLIDRETFEKGVRDLYRTAEGGGVFCYTFFKGTATKA